MKPVIIALLLAWSFATECRTLPPTKVPFDKVSNAIQYVSNRVFATDQFTTDCVSLSCPSLNDPTLCPYTPTGSVNVSSVNRTISLLNSCLRHRKLICSLPLSRLPFPATGSLLSQVFHPSMANGSCSLPTGSGHVDNLPLATFNLLPVISSDNRSVNILLNVANLAFSATVDCSLTVAPLAPLAYPLDVLRTLLDPFPPLPHLLDLLLGLVRPLHTRMPRLRALVRLNATRVTSLDLASPHPYHPRTLAKTQRMSVNFDNFTPLPPFLQIVPDVFNSVMNAYLQNAANSAAAEHFLGAFLARGIQRAALNCPSPSPPTRIDQDGDDTPLNAQI